jgi:probable HAF family extracellular repeat protein
VTLFISGSDRKDLGSGTGWSINIAGQVAGYSYTTGHATLFSAGSVPLDLDPAGISPSEGTGINDAGQVAGFSSGLFAPPFFLTHHATLFGAGSAPQDLGALGHLPNSIGLSEGAGINNTGQVAGRSTTSSNDIHATLFSAGSAPQDLGAGAGEGINNAGQVAGSSFDGVNSHATLFSAASGPQPLGTLVGYPDSKGYGINNSGQVAGYSSTTTATHATLFRVGSAPQDLNNLIGPAATNWVLQSALGINDAGQLTGGGVHGVNTRAYLATPFWRQADAVPTKWGYPINPANPLTKSDMVETGCALCSMASVARSVIALRPKTVIPYSADYVPIMTPALLDGLLTGWQWVHGLNSQRLP